MPEVSYTHCPDCGTQLKYHRVRMKLNEETGKNQFAGEYYSCKCYHLTFSPQSGKTNYKED